MGSECEQERGEGMGARNDKLALTETDALVKASGLSEKEVKEIFSDFVLQHPDGKMKRKDFRELMSSALPKKDASKIEKHAFRIYDLNNDGHIDFVEFMVVFFILSSGDHEEVLSKIFRLFDINSDGNISKKEMKKLVKAMYGLLKLENPNLSTSDNVARATFNEMDKNRDGKISREEFIQACLGREVFSRMVTAKAIDIFMEEEN